MKFLLILILVSMNAFASEPAKIKGAWKYIAYKYEGQVYPLPNPDLDLRFAFFDTQIVILRWLYNGENSYCESHGVYEVRDGDWLYQRTTWVRPGNGRSCSQHAEMHKDFESLTHFTFENNQLLLELELEGRPFFYILERVETQNTKGDL